MWIQFWDMHSGGGQKLDWSQVYIEASSREEAEAVFYNRFDRNPNRVTCTCCGPDYSISEEASLEQATGYQRGCHYDDEKKMWVEERDKSKHAYRPYIPLSEYVKQEDVLVIPASEISDSEKVGDVPEEGYVWR